MHTKRRLKLLDGRLANVLRLVTRYVGYENKALLHWRHDYDRGREAAMRSPIVIATCSETSPHSSMPMRLHQTALSTRHRCSAQPSTQRYCKTIGFFGDVLAQKDEASRAPKL